MDQLDGDARVFPTSDTPLNQEMQIRYDVQRQAIVYLTGFLRRKYPYRNENDYAEYVVGVIGPRYNRWYKSLCEKKVSDAAFVKMYYDDPEKVISDMNSAVTLEKYLNGFYFRFRKKIRKKLRLSRKTDITSIRGKAAKKSMATIDQ